ncbi:MAG: ABC transporter ATP-binding protein [Thermoanaerobaculia bacterium]
MLSLTDITKTFGETVAVDDVSLPIAPGEIVGLVGENGAGKTTLMRIVAGEIRQDSGTIEAPARIGMVHQHFAIVQEMTIAENLALLDRSPFRFMSSRSIELDAAATIARSGIDLPAVSRRAGDLAVGEKSKLELIKAIAVDPDLLILDEPTSVLTPLESDELFKVIRDRAQRGTAVVFISHKVPEVLEIAQRIVVMRGGKIVADAPRKGMTGDAIANAMVESGARAIPPARSRERSVALLQLENSLTVHRNEIVAIVGVAGNGQAELVDRLRSMRFDTHRAGFIPEDRIRDAIVAEMTVSENLALGERQWSKNSAAARAKSLIDLYRIRATGPNQRAGDLSGGNQQKVVLARELDRRPDVIVAAEPTRGLDIEATRFVHDELRKAAGAGAGLLIVTSDLDEAFALADVIHVIYRGSLSEPLTPDTAAGTVGRRMAGVS